MDKNATSKTINYIHDKKNIVHRDLKPENMLHRANEQMNQ